MSHQRVYWAVIPAAGVGRRMGGEIPKQYLPLAGKTVIEYALAPFLESPGVTAVVVALSLSDRYWDELGLTHPKLYRCDGGAERFNSVLNALQQIISLGGGDSDWVLVHDGARPCLREEDLERLMAELADDDVGGLLGVPVSDTIKRCTLNEDGHLMVETTVVRTALWRAYTPQMFRLGPLRRAIESAVAGRVVVTDDASAMELMGTQPLMLSGDPDNIKITHPQDLLFAEQVLQARCEQQGIGNS